MSRNRFIHFIKSHLLISCLVFSVMVHFLFIYAARLFGTYNFTGPVNLPRVVMVDLAGPSEPAPPAANPEKKVSSTTKHAREGKKTVNSPVAAREEDSDVPSVPPEPRKVEPKKIPTPAVSPEATSPAQSSEATSVKPPSEPTAVPPAVPRQPMIANSTRSPLQAGSEFLATKNEKLTYVISILGLPVGSAELEAKNEKGEIWITLRVRSNTAISSIFPVDDSVETRHINGQFIMTKIKQQEGSFKSDTGFTINLRKKRVSWDDFISNRSVVKTIPTDEVLDTLSAIYFLRNRKLQVGKTEVLHIFDSEVYADVPVEILRNEEMRLPNLKMIDTIVVRPLQQTAGIFRRTGDVLIWITNDDFKVPVKIVTSIALGKVTAELVSAESTPMEEEVKGK